MLRMVVMYSTVLDKMSSVDWVSRLYGQSSFMESPLKAPFSPNCEKQDYIRVGTTFCGDVLNYFG